MTDLFSSPRLRIEVAREDIVTLYNVVRDFFTTRKPYEPVVEPDRDGPYILHKVKLTEPIPERWGHTCARIAEDLRSALDQAGYATALAASVKDPQRAYFPFASRADHFDDVVRGQCKDLSPEIRTLFSSYKAYKGGNNFLWSLNLLCRGSKHRLIKPIGQAIGDSIYTNLQISGSGTFSALVPRWDTEKNEVVIFRTSPDKKIQYDASIAFFIAFGDVEVIGGEPVEATLDTFASEVASIINATEAEARRIGLFA